MCQAQDIPCGETDTHVSVRPNSCYKLDHKDKEWVIVYELGKSPQNGTERVSVTSAKTFFSLEVWAKTKSESSIIYVTMEKKHCDQAPTPLGKL